MKSMKSRRAGGASSGGIRKRGPTRTDRDGDMDMDGNGRGGKRARGNSGRSRGASGGRPVGGKARDKPGMNPDLIEKAISEDTQGPSQANVRQGKGSGGGAAQFAISGWRSSKVSSHRDGGVEHLLSFLERKMHSMTQKGPRVRISKSRVEGDILVASVRQDAADRMLRINGSNFAGVPITIEPYDSSVTVLDRQLSNGSQNASTADTKAKLTAVLSKRYFPQGHYLDLSNIMEDPDLKAMGLFENPSTESKFFPALMKLGGMQFNSSVERQEAVQSVSLARCQLTNVSSFTSLAQTFPDIKNLDLSGNKIKDSRAMVAWRWKFRNLEGLDLSDNEYSSDPNFKETMMKWYPKLQILNKVQVRTPEEIAARKKTPIPVQPPYFQDESKICENFIRAFFPAYDSDRNGLLSRFYDNNAQFSMNINTQAPKAQHTETAGWDAYIRKSRNLEKISHLPARMSRLYVGVEKIREFWNVLPQTHHPDLFTHPEHYLIECHPIPGLPDPTGQSPTGVGGLIIMVHGKFEESINGKVETRSFDRTFTIGPGNGEGGIRVLNDTVCYRAYGGHEAWSPESQAIPQAVAPAAAIAPIAAPFPEGYGAPAPGKPDAQVQQELLVVQMSAKSGMTMEYSKMALEGNSWNLDDAWNNFETLKAQGALPATAFLNGA